MGVIRRGILGGISGKVANVVGGSWKGIAYLRSLPLSVANPNTAGQIAQRTKMSNIVAFAKACLTAVIKPLNDRFASGQSGFNLFVQRNIALFALANPVAPGDLILSRGNVTPMVDLAIVASEAAGTIDATWTDNTGVGNSLATDIPFAVMQNRNTGEVTGEESGFDRSLGLFTFSVVPAFAAGDNIDIWVGMRRADGSQVSDSVYATVVAVA